MQAALANALRSVLTDPRTMRPMAQALASTNAAAPPAAAAAAAAPPAAAAAAAAPLAAAAAPPAAALVPAIARALGFGPAAATPAAPFDLNEFEDVAALDEFEDVAALDEFEDVSALDIEDPNAQAILAAQAQATPALPAVVAASIASVLGNANPLATPSSAGSTVPYSLYSDSPSSAQSNPTTAETQDQRYERLASEQRERMYDRMVDSIQAGRAEEGGSTIAPLGGVMAPSAGPPRAPSEIEAAWAALDDRTPGGTAVGAYSPYSAQYGWLQTAEAAAGYPSQSRASASSAGSSTQPRTQRYSTPSSSLPICNLVELVCPYFRLY
jgi:hypothetical protein